MTFHNESSPLSDKLEAGIVSVRVLLNGSRVNDDGPQPCSKEIRDSLETVGLMGGTRPSESKIIR
jgi:hypothetical protein